MRRAAALVVAVIGALLLAGARPGSAAPILISGAPWGQDADMRNFSSVFGVNGFISYAGFASAAPGKIFVPANAFVMIEGGASFDGAFQAYLTGNEASILGWVRAGGRLLLQSAGWDPGSYGIGPGLLIQDLYVNASNCGTLTAVGQQVLTGTPATQCGDYLAHDYVSGTGLLPLMTGSNTGATIIAEATYGAGAIIYSGLTDSEWNYSGPGLMNTLIAHARDFPIPEPAGATLLLYGLGLLAIARRSRRAPRPSATPRKPG